MAGGPGGALTRAGGLLFVLGSVLVVAAVVPAVVAGVDSPGWLAGLAWAVPSLGLGLLLAGFTRAARADGAAARARARARDAGD